MAAKNKKCSYFQSGAEICRGKNRLVNSVIDIGIMQAWKTGRTEMSKSQILTSIQTKLVEGDKAARQEEKIDACGCTKGNAVDAYHNKAFLESGISPKFYGGNLWFQGVTPKSCSV